MSPGVLVAPPAGGGGLASSAPDASAVTAALASARHTFLQPTPELHTAALELAQFYLDPLAASVSTVQQARLQDARRKRKRHEREDDRTRDVLRLQRLHLEGFNIDQVWEQARRVIDASCHEADRALRRAEAAATAAKKHQAAGIQLKRKVRFHDEDADQDLEAELEDGHSASLESDEDGLDADEGGVDEELANADTGDVDVDIDLDAMDEDSELDDGSSLSEGTNRRYIKDTHGLNDGFFSIDDFNSQTEFLERQDAKGDPDDGAATDEEDVDWSLDPTATPLPASAVKSKADQEGDWSDDEDGGPTFGDADLNAPFDSSDEDMDLEAGVGPEDDFLANTNEIYYKDFFAPPPQPPSKKPKRAIAQAEESAVEEPEDLDADMERTMAAVRRDIFEDEDDVMDEADGEAERNLSSHERRQAALAAQIRKLEAEAVAKREWAMSGEARANDRPLNSLLEEDLEFDRTGKPVPVVTAETTSSIEELIKQRILARQFDEVTKRLPGSASIATPKQRRGLADIEDRGPHQSLAAIYEAEHLQRTDPNYVDPRDTKLKAAHAQIEKLWSEVSAKLDALSNWHYRPKPPAVEVAVVTDAPRITMEDARPSGVGMAAEESGLAPQEVYKAGAAREKGEVVTKAGTIMGKNELSREEKRRHFRREKERARKQADNGVEADAPKPSTTNEGKEKDKGKTRRPKAEERKSIAEDLKRGGVKMIGKGGELVDLEGKKAKSRSDGKGVGSFRL